MRILFFGSTSDSVLVLEKLTGVVAVVTQPPKPVGRKKIITPTPVEIWAKKHHIPVFTEPPRETFDLVVSASYGEKISTDLLQSAKYGGVNVHPSLLPRWRGGDPVPWAILSGDSQTGVSIVTLTEKFDQGEIIAQTKIPISNTDVSPLLRTRLFRLGADLLVDAINKKHFHGTPQEATGQPYAKRLTREDGFESWEHMMDPKESERINRKFRAFHPWPGLWTRPPSLRSGVSGQALFQNKRIKILSFITSPEIVQLEGKKPVSWEQFKKAYF